MVPEVVGKSAYSLSLVNQAKFLETPRLLASVVKRDRGH